MTAQELLRMIAAGETLAVEFKGEERSPLTDRDLVEAAACLANRTGDEPGWLLIGVEDDGRITRREAAELCRIGPYQATRLLARLVEGGRLNRHGERKGAWYERGPKI